MYRTTRLVKALAAIFMMLLGVGLFQCARLGTTASAASPTAQQHSSIQHPALPPQPTLSALPISPSSTGPKTIPVAPDTPSSTAPSFTVAAPPKPNASAVPQAPPTRITYTVDPHDTLWQLAPNDLGNLLQWSELYDLNRDRPEPGGQALVNPNLILPSWTIEFPAGAVGLGGTSTAASSSVSGGSSS